MPENELDSFIAAVLDRCAQIAVDKPQQLNTFMS
jgi:hypothetical protein